MLSVIFSLFFFFSANEVTDDLKLKNVRVSHPMKTLLDQQWEKSNRGGQASFSFKSRHGDEVED